MKCGNDVSRRGETPFSTVFFHNAPLIVKIQRQRAGIAFAGLKLFNISDDKRKTGDALNAFIGRRNKEVDADFRHVDIHTAKRTHGIHNEGFAGRFYNGTHGSDVIENTGGCFTMHHGDDGDIGIGG